IGVEIYGGPLLNSWLDRDLGLAGRGVVRTPDGPQTRLLRIDRPLLRVPQLAIHMDDDLRAGSGLKLDPQLHMVPIWSLGPAEGGAFKALIGAELGVPGQHVVGADLIGGRTR